MKFNFFKKKKPTEVGYHLENIFKSHQADPRHFLKPSEEEISGLQIGDWVRLFFILDKDLGNGCRVERMWVEITAINGHQFTGLLTNSPAFITTVSVADTIHFSAENIATIIVPKEFDEEKEAIVSLDCLKRREINWAVRNEGLHSEKDSGWSFFTGLETQEEMDNPACFTVQPIENLLDIEPLLETVLDKAGEAYYYSAEHNQFLEDK